MSGQETESNVRCAETPVGESLVDRVLRLCEDASVVDGDGSFSSAEAFLNELLSIRALIETERTDTIRLRALDELQTLVASDNARRMLDSLEGENSGLHSLAFLLNAIEERHDRGRECLTGGRAASACLVAQSEHVEATPLISVVIPVYNSAAFLKETLDSVFEQECKSFELICIDDGSSDESLEILKEYASRSKYMSVYHQENSGLSRTRNLGLSLARGEYVYFLDSDDLLEKPALRLLTERALRDQLDVVYCDATAFYDSHDLEERYPDFKDSYARTGIYSGTFDGPELIASFYRNRDDFVPSWLSLCRTAFLKDNDIKYHEGIIHEDNAFFFITGLYAQRVGYVSIPLVRRRVRAGSIMTKAITFENVYGYYACAIDMLRAYFEKEATLSVETRSSLKALAFQTLRSASTSLEKIPEEEWGRMFGLDEDCISLRLIAYQPAWAFCSFRKQREESTCFRLERDEALKEKRSVELGISRMREENSALRDEVDRLRERNNKLRNLADKRTASLRDKKEALARSRARNRDTKEKLLAERREKARLQREIKAIKNSRSYKVGRAIAAPVRKMRKLMAPATNGAEKGGAE